MIEANTSVVGRTDTLFSPVVKTRSFATLLLLDGKRTIVSESVAFHKKHYNAVEKKSFPTGIKGGRTL